MTTSQSNFRDSSINEPAIRQFDCSVSHLLDQIPDKPRKLFISGNHELLNDRSMKFLCVIGSRKHTQYGREVVEALICSLKGHKVAIVSGLALGIDGHTHSVALECGLPCIAVPGSGIDEESLYPRTHIYLAERILERGGTLLSEFEPGTRASPWSFPMRNRIMAGLSHAVLIIEGEEDSGTLITAKLALEYNRDVFAIPGSIFSQTSKGPLNLIRNGATPICSPEDLKEALGIKPGTLFHDEALDAEYVQLSDDEIRLLGLLSEPRERAEILAASAVDFTRMQILISMLEIKDLAKESFGKIYLTSKGTQMLSRMQDLPKQ